MNKVNKHTITNIIFDVSDVLTMHAHGPDWSNRLLSEETGVSLQVIKDFFHEYIVAGRKTHGLSFDEFWPNRTVNTENLSLEDVKKSGQRHADHIVINPEMITILADLQPRYRLFALTNTWRPGHPFKPQLEKYFQAFVQSCDIQLSKPDPEVFRYMLNTYSLIASETLLTDNKEENIRGAERVGMYGILFTNAEDFKQKLEQYIEKDFEK